MSRTETLTLTDFLLARLAEDEAVAKGNMGDDPNDSLFRYHFRRPDWGTWGAAYDCHGIDDGYGEADQLAVDPARVLADVEAKRRIVERCVKDLAVTDERDIDSITRSFNAGAAYQAHNTLLDLAQPYADHDQFREEWRNA